MVLDIDTKALMSETKFYDNYSRYNGSRYETWEEAVSRVMNMHRGFYEDKMSDELSQFIDEAESLYKLKYVLGAQRALQFGGDQILKHHMRMYNCTSTYADRDSVFGEIFYILLCGAGAGFSVQKHHIAKMSKVMRRNKMPKTHVVEDSIEGWATALDVLMSSFFVGGGKHPEYEGRRVYFDLSLIRPKGALISGGFKAPGPEPLRRALDKIEHLLNSVVIDVKEPVALRPIHVYDIVMYASDAVLSGGVRRSATICLFSKDDDEMAKAKTGNWYVTNPQRGRSNNSAVLVRDEVTREEFAKLMKNVREFGEPGFVFSSSTEHTFNPCLTGDSLVTVKDHDIYDNGELIAEGSVYQIRMDMLVKNFEEGLIIPAVLSYNEETGDYEWDEITNAAMTRNDADVVELEFEDGVALRCTPDHKILTDNRGWVEAKDLTDEDDIVSFG